MSSSYRSNRLGLSHWDPYAVGRSGCLLMYYCNMVEWFWWDSSLITTTNCLIVPETTYYALSGTLTNQQSNNTNRPVSVENQLILIIFGMQNIPSK